VYLVTRSKNNKGSGRDNTGLQPTLLLLADDRLFSKNCEINVRRVFGKTVDQKLH
jgi:hypothetical protein